jgi:hypothetical protein
MGGAVGTGEDQPRVHPGRPDLGAFLVLASLVLAQGGQGGRVQGQGPLAHPGLGLGLVHHIVDHHAGPPGGEPSGVEVDVDPAQPGQFGAPHPGGGDQQPQRVQAIVASVGQEAAELLGGPDLHLGGGAPGWGDGVGHVADQVAEADGILEGPVQHRVDVAHRLGAGPGRPAGHR